MGRWCPPPVALCLTRLKLPERVEAAGLLHKSRDACRRLRSQVVVILSTNKYRVFIRGIEGAVTVDLASTSLWYHALRLWQLMTSRGQTPCLPSSEPVMKNLHGLCSRVDAVISFKSWRSINVGSVCDLLQDLTNEATLLDYNYPII